jgi:hypothetical protein
MPEPRPLTSNPGPLVELSYGQRYGQHGYFDLQRIVYFRNLPDCPKRVAEIYGAPRFFSGSCVMTHRVRHCIECPKCRTRYLVGFSPYDNGSYLLPLIVGFAEEWTLYCSCGQPHVASRWCWNELNMYAVSHRAHERGYGSPDEIGMLRKKSRQDT